METIKKDGVMINFPNSRMEQINDTAQEPFKYVALLHVTFPNGEVCLGTGTLIGDRYVLTAAHNVMNDTYGKAAKIVVMPGQNGNVQPFGSFHAVDFFVTEAYKTTPAPYPVNNHIHDFTRYMYDYAVIQLNEPVFQQNLPIQVATDLQLKGKASIAGYPGDKAHGTMWTAQNDLVEDPDNGPFLFYQISTYFGDSGAAVLKEIDGKLMIVGVHVAGSEGLQTNFGVRILDEVYDQIEEWMRQ